MTEEQNNAKSIIEFAKENLEPKMVEAGGITFAVMPNGQKLVSIKPLLDEYLTRPERKRGVARLTTVQSLIDITNRFKDGNSAIFVKFGVEGQGESLTTVFDYNEATPEGSPRFGEHMAVYDFPKTEKWKTWLGMSKEKISQIEFANFIEENILDLLAPPSAEDKSEAAENIRAVSKKLGLAIAGPEKLLELARGLSIFEGAKATNVVNTSSGEIQIEFTTEHRDASGQRFSPPGLFLIGVQIFEDGPAYRIPVRLRYRLQNGQIAWIYEILNAQQYVRDAITDTVALAKEKTDLPLFFGMPERP